MKPILEIPTAIQDTIVSVLREKSFLHPPTYMFSTCVDPLNHDTEASRFSYYGQECSLMQSLIFHKMILLGLSDIESVFWISPNIRKELNVVNSGRYSTEFTQIDFESSALNYASCLDLIEEITIRTIDHLVSHHSQLIGEISGRTLKRVSKPLVRLDTVAESKRRGVSVSVLEKELSEEISDPVILTNLKREAYDKRDEVTGKYLNFDIIMPKMGEILSGGEREHTHERLVSRMNELRYPLNYFSPVLEIAKSPGLKPSAGAGFGLERFVRAILFLENISDVYPFKRIPGEPIVF